MEKIVSSPSGTPAIPDFDSIQCKTEIMNDKLFVNCQWNLPGFTDDIQHVEAEIQCDGKQMHSEKLHKENLATTTVLPLVVNGNYSLFITTVTFCNKRQNITVPIDVDGVSTTHSSCPCPDCTRSQDSSSSGVTVDVNLTVFGWLYTCIMVVTGFLETR
jgi:hypothetical protein